MTVPKLRPSMFIFLLFIKSVQINNEKNDTSSGVGLCVYVCEFFYFLFLLPQQILTNWKTP